MAQRRCIVVSLVRHAQCDGNVLDIWKRDDEPNPLTERGFRQAEVLGEQWKDTRIDKLLSSPSSRAYDTAKAISDKNNGKPHIISDHLLVERRFGEEVPEAMRRNQQWGWRTLTGKSMSDPGPVDRLYSPPAGGECLDEVAKRGEKVILRVLRTHGVSLSEPPEFFLQQRKATSPADLPDGIPHVVIVSHNVFLSELYEKLHYWQGDYKQTSCDYGNASWSRHILWYDQDEDDLAVVNMKDYPGRY